MIIKITGICLIMFSSTLIGLYYSNRDFFRQNDLKEIKKALLILMSEIDYCLTPLPLAMRNISTRINNPISKIFLNCSDIISQNTNKSMNEIWKESIDNNKEELYLNEEDIGYLYSFGKTLGYLDKGLQINNISITVKYIEEKINELNESITKNKKLYQSAGILCGLIICIVLI